MHYLYKLAQKPGCQPAFIELTPRPSIAAWWVNKYFHHKTLFPSCYHHARKNCTHLYFSNDRHSPLLSQEQAKKVGNSGWKHTRTHPLIYCKEIELWCWIAFCLWALLLLFVAYISVLCLCPMRTHEATINIFLENLIPWRQEEQKMAIVLHAITKSLVICSGIKYKMFSFPLYRKFNRAAKRGHPSTMAPTIKSDWC